MHFPTFTKYYGKDEPLPESRTLKAGPLTVEYEAGFLRYIRLGEVEILRNVYHAVRDHNWDTILGEVTEEKIEAGVEHFSISFRYRCEGRGIIFDQHCRYEGKKDGTVICSIEGEAVTPFRRNRLGFCLLHPVKECKEQPCKVIHTDGSETDSHFPRYISPNQPFKDMREIEWLANGRVKARVKFEGDIFEMEDQRNWTDDSFKCYCPPLELPFPVALHKGDKIAQTITLMVEGAEGVTSSESGKVPVQISLLKDAAHQHLPRFGIGRSTEAAPTETDAEIIGYIPLDHYRADLHLREHDWESQADQAVREGNKLRLPLKLALFFTDGFDQETTAFLQWATRQTINIDSILFFHESHKSTPDVLLNAVVPALRKALPQVPLGAGSDAYFTELNRGRVDPQPLDFLSYSLNPQVHAFDNASLTETLAAQEYTVDSTRQFADGKPIQISPVTMQPRFNPNATGPEPEPLPGELPSQVDIRQMSLYGAGWTLGSLKYLTEAGVEAVTYYQTVGRQGVIHGDHEPQLPDKFAGFQGMIYPMFFVFQQALKFSHAIPTQSSDRLTCDGWMVEEGDRQLLLLANYTADDQTVEVETVKQRATYKVLDASNFEQAVNDPAFLDNMSAVKLPVANHQFVLTLSPYAVAFVALA